MTRFAMVVAALAVLKAQSSGLPAFEPRTKIADYAASKPLAGESQALAAESLARSVPVSRGGVLFAEDHIVIETAFFGPAKTVLAVAPEHFTLVVNGKKPEILPDTAGSVVATMRDSFSTRPNLEVGGSVNNTGVVLGRRRPQTGIPDIDDPKGRRLPPRAPGADDRAGTDPNQPVNVREEVERVALVRGEYKLPNAGLLYFPYRGKLKSIKSMVLRYHPPDGSPIVELVLVP